MALTDDVRPGSTPSNAPPVQGSSSPSFFGRLGPGFDEAIADDGQIRPSWRALFEHLERWGLDERAHRRDLLERQIRQTGIAQDIFSDPSADDAHWRLDLTPIVMSEDEWTWLSSAVAQRADVLNKVLADIYGPKDLLKSGTIPAELVYSDETFLRPCEGAMPVGGPLTFYAVDLARGSDGRWRAIDNHTETLAGIGFALANRIAHTHVAGDLFKACNAQRLAPYFQRMQTVLRHRAGREDPTIAILTPGPQHPDFFSHAFVARYLGVLLVEGPDLRTRGDRVFLKTLEGLKPIDLIIRCTDGHLSDPLELDASGFLGPPGLVEAMRRNPKLLANPLGSAVAQNRGLGPFMEGLCHQLLGEPLRVPDSPRWWLGQAGPRQHVADHLTQFVVRSCQERTGRPGQATVGHDSKTLTPEDREHLLRDIELHGARRVAEAPYAFSSAPVLEDGRWVARPFGLRMFALNTGAGFEVMPGGLAMTVSSAPAVALSAPDGDTREVWALSDQPPVQHVSLWRPSIEAARVARSHRILQSRVADSLFWLGRFAERADWTMRVMRSGLRRLEEHSGPLGGRSAASVCLELLLQPSSNAPVDSSRLREGGDEIEALCTRMIADRSAPRALDPTMSGLYRNASLTRDRLSHEAWRALSVFQSGSEWRRVLGQSDALDLVDLLDEGTAALAAFNGLMHENMTRNYGWSFLDMGRRLERAYNLCEAMHALFVPSPDEAEEASNLFLLLEIADCFITYRSRYRLDPMLPLVLDLLLLDETNPRSLAYQLHAITEHLGELPGGMHGVARSEERRMALGLLTSVRLMEVDTVEADATRLGLGGLLSEQIDSLPELSDLIARHYFNLADSMPHSALRRGY